MEIQKGVPASAGLKQIDIDELISSYGVSEEPLVVDLPNGEQLKFRVPTTLADARGVLKRAVAWFNTLPDTHESAHPFAGILPKNREEAVDAFLISEFSLEPRISQKQALTMVAKAPWLAFSLSQAIRTHWKDMETLWMARAAEEAKKNLSETNGEDSSSE